MKNKKRIKFGILIATILVVAIIGTIGVKKMNEPTEKEKQIAFLKKHEEEMTEYVKYDSEHVLLKKYDVKEVTYNWQSVIEVQSMAFSPKTIAVEVSIFDGTVKKLDGFEIYVLPDNVKNPTEIKNIA
ncbi:hypothetical protein [Enterococcus faecalis]|uniref:hypothetical protein n=1 Tax=Enterococcus faecalis TaxID=1351 RepID=UPI001C8CB0FF|nr:hypothetical protein [Enterococcus faecalis]MBX8941266.1 hypothetical protein [Enterococcus faecalis]